MDVPEIRQALDSQTPLYVRINQAFPFGEVLDSAPTLRTRDVGNLRQLRDDLDVLEPYSRHTLFVDFTGSRNMTFPYGTRGTEILKRGNLSPGEIEALTDEGLLDFDSDITGTLKPIIELPVGVPINRPYYL